jgi:hypothetical protein
MKSKMLWTAHTMQVENKKYLHNSAQETSLKMSVYSSETSVNIHQTTRHLLPEDKNLHGLKQHRAVSSWWFLVITILKLHILLPESYTVI